MECYYHPDRESTDTCAICGKSICKECGLEIAGKIYCKECLEKIVGLGIENKSPEPVKEEVAPQPLKTEPARLEKRPVEENIYQRQPVEEVPPAPEEVQPTPEIKQVSDDSPYNIKSNIQYEEGLETSYLEKEPVEPKVEPIPQKPQITQNEVNYPREEIPQQKEPEYIYPDHSYEPEPTSARMELEDKYEKYLDDLYFDEKEVPLGEQLAKDEAEYGSLTRKEYPKREEAPVKQKAPRNETPEEMEARIRAEILAEKEGGKKLRDKKDEDTNIHNLNYQNEKEPMGVVDVLLTILLIIVILVVIYYIIYIIVLHSTYPTFIDAIYALSNPQNVINNALHPIQ